MSKGNKVRKKEVKKPKQVKPKVPATASHSSRVGELPLGSKNPKK